MGTHTPREVEIAVKVMFQSRIVRKWIAGQLRWFGLDPLTPEGRAFAEREGMKMSRRLVS